MRKALVIILIVIVVAGVAYMGWKYYELNEYAGNLDMTLSHVQGELSESRSKFSEAEKTISQTEEKVTQAEEQIKNLEGDITSYKSQINDLNAQVSEQLSQIGDLEEKVFCTDHPKIDPSYTTNSTASSKLRDWVGDVGGSVNNPTWDVIWSNSKAAIHYLPTSEHLNVFVVYFDEPAIESTKGVFWLNGECWLKEK